MAERQVKVLEIVRPEGTEITLQVDGKNMTHGVSLNTIKVLARVLGATVTHERHTMEEVP